MTTNDWEKEFEYSFGLDHPIQTFRDHDDYLLVRDFIESLLNEARREVIEDIPDVIMPNAYDSINDESYVKTVEIKQRLHSKYLTPTGNLNN